MNCNMSVFDTSKDYNEGMIAELVIRFYSQYQRIPKEKLYVEFGGISIENILNHPERYVIGVRSDIFGDGINYIRICNIKSIYREYYKFNKLTLSKIFSHEFVK